CLTLEGRCEIKADAGSDLTLSYPGNKRV
ncbi:MAG: phosphoheptose isomerase, partial [Sphingomonas sp.]